MSDLPEAEIVRALDEVRSGGPGHHVHLDELLRAPTFPVGDVRWISLARQIADVATRTPGRFIVVVPLGSHDELPLKPELSNITVPELYEPPAVYYLSDHDAPRTWTGEYFRLDLPES